MDVQEVGRLLLEGLGGKDNIRTNDACITRLRVGVLDKSLVDLEAIGQIDGVLGVVEADTLQVVFGPGVVNKVLDAFVALSGVPRGGAAADAVEVARQNKASAESSHDGPVQAALKHVANVFVPLLPGIIAAGLINGATNAVNALCGDAVAGLWWYQCIRTLGWGLFAYLPIFAGYNAARELGGTPVLGGVVGTLCVANASMPFMQEFGGAQVVILMTNAVYNPASGGLIAAIFAACLVAWLEKCIRSVMPGVLDTFATPLLSVIAAGIVLVVVVQPLSVLLMQGIYGVMSFAYEGMGVVGGFALAAGFLPLVSVGLHQALTPIHAMLNDPAGPTQGINYLLPVLMMAGGGQVGAGLALYRKTKNGKLKGLVRDSIAVGILGVGEPLMYAVTLPLGKSFVTACLGAGLRGTLATLLHIGTILQGVSGLLGLLIVVPGQQLGYVAAMLGAYVGGFVLMWFFGVDEKRVDEVYDTD